MPASIEVYNPMSAYNGAIKKLENSGIRATKQRRVLAKLKRLELLLDNYEKY